MYKTTKFSCTTNINLTYYIRYKNKIPAYVSICYRFLQQKGVTCLLKLKKIIFFWLPVKPFYKSVVIVVNNKII